MPKNTMQGFTKLYSSLLTSTIWRASDTSRIVWITMLALANKDGVISSSIPGLADMARVSIEDCEQALIEFESPDPYSRTSEYDGRRIETLDGVGWRLLNHSKYRDDPASRMLPADEKMGKIYFIQCNDAVKIGFSQNPWARLATLKTAMPDNPILLGSFNGVLQDETDLHAQFKHLRINREWFRADDELLAHIQERLGIMVADGSNYAETTTNYNNTDTDTDTDTEADTDTKAEKKKNKKAVADAPDVDLKRSSRPKKPSSPKDGRSARPIILAVKELMNRYPDKLLWDKLIARFGDDFDSAKLRECREAWLERGYNANATTWLNWYFDGIPTRQTPKPETQSYNYVRNQPTQREAIEAEQRMIAEMREQ